MIPQNKIKYVAHTTVFTLALAAILTGSAYGQARHGTLESSIHNKALAVSPDGRTAVASCSERPDVIIYDLEAKRVRGVLNHFITPRDIQFDPTGRYFYVSDSSLGVVKKIDTASLKTISVLLASPGPFGTTISNDGRTLYVNNEAASIVTVFDLVSGQPIAHINPYSQPRAETRCSSDRPLLYVIDFWDDKVDIVDTATEQIAEQISGFSKIRAISVTRDGKTLFAANSGTDTIAVVDLPSRSIIATIAVGRKPYGVALSPDEQFAYVGNLTDNTLSVVALSSLQVTATIFGFIEPAQAIAFARDGSNAYVLNSGLSVSIVNLTTNRIVSTMLPGSNVETAGISAVEGEIQ
jgi:YVTN family beta-propeller protein